MEGKDACLSELNPSGFCKRYVTGYVLYFNNARIRITIFAFFDPDCLLLSNRLFQRNLVPKKFRGIDSKWVPLFRGRKCSFRGIPRFTEESIPRLGKEGNDMKKN
jgi:hypothetical protein